MCPRERMETADIIVDLLLAYLDGIAPDWRESPEKKNAVDRTIDSIWATFKIVRRTP